MTCCLALFSWDLVILEQFWYAALFPDAISVGMVDAASPFTFLWPPALPTFWQASVDAVYTAGVATLAFLADATISGTAVVNAPASIVKNAAIAAAARLIVC